ncbi:YicC/YloC family endoribonuclease [Senegalia massiliensis]|uniref:YicC/YloC family endoribonuclease n=1 Tax=Senegalia massiliensis TaxID=1720316 RepID=UPI00103160DA|nr:YicC/YloC family endoribonuclease [Senegalia massiliensis]
MVKSMTGFGRGENKDESRQFNVEIKSVNHRYNDIIIRMPRHLSYLEEKIKTIIKKKIKRGRVEVYINLENIGETQLEVNVNLDLAKSYKEALSLLNQELNLDDSIKIESITKYPDIINVEKKEESEDVIWNVLSVAVEDSVKDIYSMRCEEGDKLAQDIKKRLDYIKNLNLKIEERSPLVVEEYKSKLENRINDLLDNSVEVDESKLANEVAYFADKANITEEIVRLDSHIIQLIETLSLDDAIGRKLDFLIQEMNREANTMGSKVGDIEITKHVVEIKSELEKIREQVQNIE